MRATRYRLWRVWTLLLTLPPAPVSASLYAGTVVDAATARPLANALVTLQGRTAKSDSDGTFAIEGEGPNLLRIRAIGYGRVDVPIPEAPSERLTVALPELHPKALYLSIYGVGDQRLRERALELVATTELNSLVVDVKGDYGKVPYASSVALAADVGALSRRTIQDERALLASLHDRGIYVIARVVVFKDRLLAAARPELAVRSADGSLWYDRENSPWIDPFRKEAWDYNLDLAVEASEIGFDEIQFDYIRFPDGAGLHFSRPNTQPNRIETIGGFLVEARRRLAPYNVFLSADVFGYVCWNTDDTMIGQRIEDLAPLVDYVSPMLYPSSFQFGIPGYRMPVANPYEVVRLSLDRAERRTHLPAGRFRPWLQAFRDYAFDRRAFDGGAIREEIRAAEDFGANGWMLWNAANVYAREGLREK